MWRGAGEGRLEKEKRDDGSKIDGKLAIERFLGG